MSTVKTTNITHGSNSGTANLTLASDGKVGIGIASPTGIFAVSDGTRTAEINPHSNGTYIGNRTNHHVLFQVNAAEKARITTNGTLLVAITNGQEEPGNTNTTEGSSFKWDGRFFHSMPGTWGLMNRNDSDGTLCVFAREGVHVGNIGVNSSSTSYNTSSDYRLKENVTAISDGITRLKTLKPSRFNFKVDKDKTVDGFIAHEVTAVPEAITGEKDGSEMQQIDQSKLVPLLTAALQETIKEVETLKTKVAALESA